MLSLRFGTQAGRVEVSADSAYTDHLNSMSARFATSGSVGISAFDVDLDDLLLNLNELAAWPAEDEDIRWQPELLALVEGNATDAQVAERRLSGGDDAALGSLPNNLLVEWALTPFQQRDLAKLLELDHGANFSVPGAGKTRVTLAAFVVRRSVGQIRRMLVVCPKAAFESWQDETATCFPDMSIRVAVFNGGAPPSADILLVNYERLLESRTMLLAWLRARPAMLVLDEAHRTKLGPAGAWGATCLSLGPFASHRLILSGTPAPNGAKDLANLMSFVWPGQGRAAVTRAVEGHDLRTASRLLSPLFVRTTKKELDLPPVHRTVRRIHLPPLHRELYNALLGQESRRWRGGSQDAEALGRILLYLLMAATTPALLATGASRHEPLPYRVPPLEVPTDSTLATLLRDLPHYELSPKYQEVLSIVALNAAAGRKTLVWSTFVRNLTSLEVLLQRYSPAVVHGGTEDRPDQLKRFREDPDCMVLLSNPATLGEGVSLHQVCNDAVYVDRDFAAGRFMQSLDRIHRLGLAPEAETRITMLVANETVDEIVEQRLGTKLRFMGGILDDPAVLQLSDLDEEPSASVGMDMSDLRALVGYLDGSAS